MNPTAQLRRVIPALAVVILSTVGASAQPLAWSDPQAYPNSFYRDVMPEPEQAVPDDDQVIQQSPAVRERFRRQMVAYNTTEAPGTVIIDTPNTYLYYVLGGGRAIRYGIGVGREGFTWAGVQSIARKQEWPDWHPPAEMIARQPYLPRMMAGGPGNPLGARAMYLGNSLYRIHGTNAPDTIGQRVSSGCIRLTNEDVTDLFNRVSVGTKVVVLPDHGRRMPVASIETHPATARAPAASYQPARAPEYSGSSVSRIY
jgi:lipoprotein-anchoring transpeptidase ErfK/SrfK